MSQSQSFLFQLHNPGCNSKVSKISTALHGWYNTLDEWTDRQTGGQVLELFILVASTIIVIVICLVGYGWFLNFQTKTK